MSVSHSNSHVGPCGCSEVSPRNHAPIKLHSHDSGPYGDFTIFPVRCNGLSPPGWYWRHSSLLEVLISSKGTSLGNVNSNGTHWKGTSLLNFDILELKGQKLICCLTRTPLLEEAVLITSPPSLRHCTPESELPRADKLFSVVSTPGLTGDWTSLVVQHQLLWLRKVHALIRQA